MLSGMELGTSNRSNQYGKTCYSAKAVPLLLWCCLLLFYGCSPRQPISAEVQEIAMEDDRNKALTDTLKKTIIPAIDINKASIHDAFISVITLANSSLPPERQIQYIIADPSPELVDAGQNKVTLHLKNVPAFEALHYLLGAAFGGFTYRLSNGRLYIYLTSCAGADSLVTTRVFCVPGVFFNTNGSQRAAKQIDVKSQLQDRGIEFNSDCKAFYVPKYQLLYVRNSLDQLDLIEELLKLPPSASTM